MQRLDLGIERFDACNATEADLASCFRIMESWWKRDKPDLPPLTYDACISRLREPLPGYGQNVKWVARRRGEIVGMASVYFLENESTHIGLTEVVVHPEERRQGIGTALLARLLPELRARGRTIVEGWQLTFGGDGPKWAEARGFRSVHTMLLQTLEIEEADDALWQVDVPAGYRTQRWIGAAPEELIGSFAQARDAIHDAPIGELAYREPVWTVDSVRAHEAEFRARGVENRVVVAIDESTGEVAGMTELAVKATNPLWGYQRETAVLPSHRGRGLGRCIKAEMIRWLLAERPGFVRIQTTTAAENVHMSRVNLQLGFQTVRTTLGVNAEVDTLESKLAQLDLH